MHLTSIPELFGTFAAAALLDFAWLRWTTSAASGTPLATASWGVAIGALGLAGLSGALTGPVGVISYLAGLGVGSFTAAYLHQRSRG